MHVTGTTRIYFIFGDPVAQVRAPEIYNELFARHGVDAVLVPIQVPAAQASALAHAVLAAGNVGGLWLTIPHKSVLLDELASCDLQGRVAGAVNAVRRSADGALHGALFDGTGLVKALRHFGLVLAGKRVLLLGAGGAGSAIAAALCRDASRAVGEAPLAELALFDAQPGRAAATVARLSEALAAGTAPAAAPAVAAQAADGLPRIHVAPSSDPSGYDLIINATPLGLNAADPLPLDVARLSAGAAVVDILMKRASTPLVQACLDRGIPAWPGHEMMTQQVGDYLRFFGHAAMADAVEADLDLVRQLFAASALRTG
jgi:shikimate dehydrogenase